MRGSRSIAELPAALVLPEDVEPTLGAEVVLVQAFVDEAWEEGAHQAAATAAYERPDVGGVARLLDHCRGDVQVAAGALRIHGEPIVESAG